MNLKVTGRRGVYLSKTFTVILALQFWGASREARSCPDCKEGETEIEFAYWGSGSILKFNGTERRTTTELGHYGPPNVWPPPKVKVPKKGFRFHASGVAGLDSEPVVEFVLPCGVTSVEVSGVKLVVPKEPGGAGHVFVDDNTDWVAAEPGSIARKKEISLAKWKNRDDDGTYVSLGITNWKYRYGSPYPQENMEGLAEIDDYIKFNYSEEGEGGDGGPSPGSFHDSWNQAEGFDVFFDAEHLADCSNLESVTFSNAGDEEEATDNSTHKQLRVEGKGAVDVLKSGQTLSISFYAEANVGALGVDGFYAVSGTPKTKIVFSPGSNNTIVEQRYDNGTATGNWVFSEASSPATSSILNTNTGKKHVRIKGTDTNGDRYETSEVLVVASGQPDKLSYKVTDTYHTYTVGTDVFEKLIKSVDDSYGTALTTKYVYGTTPGVYSYQNEIAVSYPDGTWLWRQWEGNPLGVKVATWSGYLDTPFPTSMPTNDAGFRKVVEFRDDAAGETILVTYENGYRTAKSMIVTDRDSFDGVSNLNVRVASQWHGMGVSDSITTTTFSYPTSIAYLGGRVFATVNPDLTGQKYEYAKGTYNSGTGAFTADANGTFERQIEKRGRVISSGTVMDFAAFKSTATETIEDADGNVLQTREYLYDGTNFNTVLSITKYTYTDGNLTQTTRDGVVTYSANYIGDELQDSTDEFGVVTTTTKVGTTETTTTNDGAGDMVSTTVTDDSGTVLSATNQGLTTHFSSSANSTGGKIETVTNPSGATDITESHLDGRTKNVSGTAQPPVSYSYTPDDGSLKTDETTTAASQSRTISRVTDMIGRTKSITRPKFGSGTTTDTYHYYSSGQLESITSDSGRAPRRFTYDSLGNQLWSGIDMDGGGLSASSATDRITKTERNYRTTGGYWYSVTAFYQHLPSGWVLQQETWDRVDGRENFTIGPNNHKVTTTMSVDRANHITTILTTDPQVGTSSAKYWSNNRLKESQDPWQYGTANKTSYHYNGNGRLDQTTDAATRSTGHTYYPDGVIGAGQLDTTTLPGGATIKQTYTLEGQVDTETGTGTYYKHYAYNGFGELTGLATKRASAEVWTLWGRDPGTGLVSSKSYNANSATGTGTGTVQYGYNAAGNLTTRTWARSGAITTTFGRNGAGDLTSISYSDGTPGASNMGYDCGGRLTSVTDASGTRAITYSNFGQRASENYTGSGILSGAGVVRAYSGDRRTSLSVSGWGSGYPDLSYNYDAEGRLSTITDQGQEHIMAYVPRYGMLQPSTITMSTGDAGEDGGLLVRNFDYDNLGRLTSVVNGGDAGVVFSAHGTSSNPIHYDTAGRRDIIPREDGSKWNYGYNTRNEVTSGAKKFSGGTLFVLGHQFTYNYDGIGNRLSASAGGDSSGANLTAISYAPNNLNQYSAYTNPTSQWVTGEAATTANVFVNGEWTWRNGTFFGKTLDLGNGSGPVSKAVTVQAKGPPSGGSMVVNTQSGSLLEAPASVSPAYDDDGNLTNDGLWSYTWDGENRLVSMETVPSLPESAQRKLAYGYDFEGRRVNKISYAKSGSSWVADASGTTKFLYDGWNMIEEINSTANRSYIWGLDLSGTLDGAGGVGGLLAMQDTNGSFYWYASDFNGNVTALVAASSGLGAAKYEYGPFGELLRASGPMAKVNPFQFSTNYTDNESGLVNGKLRWYYPLLGRWLSRDPSGERGGENLYGFVRNNPLKFVDPLGLEVLAIFNVQVGLLSVTDLDTNETAMIRATSGIPELQNKFDKEWSDGGPIPRGDYEILNRIMDPNDPNPALDKKQNEEGVWSLDREDSNPRNDGTGRGRGLFRLHTGSSTGCVVTDDLTDFSKVARILNSTKTRTVKDSKGRERTYYGRMMVVSAPRPPELAETKDKKKLEGPKQKSIWEKLFKQQADPKFENKK